MNGGQSQVNWRARLADRVSNPWGKGALAVLVCGLLYWNALQFWQLRPGGKAPPQSPNAVICIQCDWRGWRTTEKLPQRCPKCRRMTLHFAGVCPDCGEWTAWDIEKEKLLYARPRLFIDLGPSFFFPKCRRCGSQTTPRGELPVKQPSRLPDRDRTQ